MAGKKNQAFCENCGAPLAPGSNYCDNCGMVSLNTLEEKNRKQRYRQEELGEDWSEDWNRSIDESRATAGQYVLIVLLAVSLTVLVAFGAYWFFGRSHTRDASQRGMQTQEEGNAQPRQQEQQQQQEQEEQQEQQQEQQDQGSIITILDPKPNAGAEEGDAPAGVQEGDASTGVQEGDAPAGVQEGDASAGVQPDVVLSYGDFQVTLPGSWTSKYGISQNNDTATFYHRASKELGYEGTLFCISRCSDNSYQSWPDYHLIGTGNQRAYVLTTPTDVQSAPDEAVAQEYQAMAADIPWILERVELLVQGEGPAPAETPIVVDIDSQQAPQAADPTAGQGDYILPESSSRLLSEGELSGMSYDELQMAINEIYARHGRKFVDASIQEYFDSKPWYSGTVEPEAFDQSVFSETEAANIDLMVRLMAER